MTMIRLSHFISIVLLTVLSIGVAANSVERRKGNNPQTQFLLEILMGRCYYQPPKLDDPPQVCPSLIPGLVGILQSHLDADITPESFETYFSAADLTSPEDGAFFLLDTCTTDGVGQSVGNDVLVPPGLKRPEDTLGGSIITDLVFCGTDSQKDCSFGNFDKDSDKWTGAQASFWFRAYGSFASLARGRVQVAIVTNDVMSDDNSVELFLSAAIPNFDPSSVTGLDFYMVGSGSGGESSCNSEIMGKFAEPLEQVDIKHTCTEDSDWSRLFFCSSSLGSEQACSNIKSMAVIHSETKTNKSDANSQNGGTPPSGESYDTKPGFAVIPALIWIFAFGGVIAFLVKKIGWPNDYVEVQEQDPEMTHPEQ